MGRKLVEPNWKRQVVIRIVIFAGFPCSIRICRFGSGVLVDGDSFEYEFAYRKSVGGIEVVSVATSSC